MSEITALERYGSEVPRMIADRRHGGGWWRKIHKLTSWNRRKCRGPTPRLVAEGNEKDAAGPKTGNRDSQSGSSSWMGVGSIKKISMSYFRVLVRQWFPWRKSVFI